MINEQTLEATQVEFKKHLAIEMILEKGLRPTIPVGCFGDIARVIQQCWKSNPKDRPSWSKIISSLEVSLASTTKQDRIAENTPNPHAQEIIKDVSPNRNKTTFQAQKSDHLLEPKLGPLRISGHKPPTELQKKPLSQTEIQKKPTLSSLQNTEIKKSTSGNEIHKKSSANEIQKKPALPSLQNTEIKRSSSGNEIQKKSSSINEIQKKPALPTLPILPTLPSLPPTGPLTLPANNSISPKRDSKNERNTKDSDSPRKVEVKIEPSGLQRKDSAKQRSTLITSNPSNPTPVTPYGTPARPSTSLPFPPNFPNINNTFGSNK